MKKLMLFLTIMIMLIFVSEAGAIVYERNPVSSYSPSRGTLELAIPFFAKSLTDEYPEQDERVIGLIQSGFNDNDIRFILETSKMMFGGMTEENITTIAEIRRSIKEQTGDKGLYSEISRIYPTTKLPDPRKMEETSYYFDYSSPETKTGNMLRYRRY